LAVDIGSLRKILELEQQKGYPDYQFEKSNLLRI